MNLGAPYNPFDPKGWSGADLNVSPTAFEDNFECGQARPSLAKTVVTIGEATYGCGTDDTTSPGCIPE